jgi:hypothetical protein
MTRFSMEANALARLSTQTFPRSLVETGVDGNVELPSSQNILLYTMAFSEGEKCKKVL